MSVSKELKTSISVSYRTDDGVIAIPCNHLQCLEINKGSSVVIITYFFARIVLQGTNLERLIKRLSINNISSISRDGFSTADNDLEYFSENSKFKEKLSGRLADVLIHL